MLQHRSAAVLTCDIDIVQSSSKSACCVVREGIACDGPHGQASKHRPSKVCRCIVVKGGVGNGGLVAGPLEQRCTLLPDVAVEGVLCEARPGDVLNEQAGSAKGGIVGCVVVAVDGEARGNIDPVGSS